MRRLAPLLLLVAVALQAQSPTQEPAAAATIDVRLRDELLAMRDIDHDMRREWIAHPQSLEIQKQIEDTDESHFVRLREIVREHGWPGRSLVTDRGSTAAWLVVQHGGPSAIKEMLPLMQQAAKNGELDPSLYATSVDRDLINDSKKQRYGTHFNMKGGVCTVQPLEDPAHVDDLRKAVGLGTLAEYAQRLCSAYKPAAPVKP